MLVRNEANYIGYKMKMLSLEIKIKKGKQAY